MTGTTPPPPVSLWELPERGARGPKPRHDRAAIASAAVRIADAEGLEGLTMRRVASDLGMATMTLYNYLPTKDHLAQLVIDELAAEYTYPPEPPADPRSAIFEHVWGYDFGPTSNALGVYMGYLRRKTEAGGEPRVLHTVRGVGYILRED